MIFSRVMVLTFECEPHLYNFELTGCPYELNPENQSHQLVTYVTMVKIVFINMYKTTLCVKRCDSNDTETIITNSNFN